ncbi:MAG: hypothetical protein WCN98_18870, partial [Verrucomicrobiaceae bacterium]
MKATSTTPQARLRLPGTAAPDNSSHDTPNVMPPPKPLRRILTGLAAALTLAFFVSPASAVELIENGSFETGTVPANGSHENLAGSNVTGWTTGGSGGIVWYMT